MTRKRRSAAASVSTRKSARTSPEVPFRRNSIRERAYLFLMRKRRTYKEFYVYVSERLGGDPSNLLRYFRMLGVVEEQGGKIWSR
jgi:hypothetical protein